MGGRDRREGGRGGRGEEVEIREGGVKGEMEMELSDHRTIMAPCTF